MRKFLTLSLLVMLTTAFADQPTAKSLVDSAVAKASKENKSVMVMFDASWCGWCKRLDAYLALPKVKEIMEANFVEIRIDVLESDKKELENPGGIDYMKQWKGEGAGLPFTVILDGKGKMVVNSMMEVKGKPTNIGCPWAPEEQDHFFKMIQKARPALLQTQIATLKSELTAFISKTEKKGGG